MKKKYLVEFTHLDGKVESIELVTEDIEWSIEQWCRNRAIAKHQIIEEGQSNNKRMLFGQLFINRKESFSYIIIMENLKSLIKEVISEATKVNFAGHKFVLKIDVNEDPNKKGVKVQFIPTSFGKLTSTEQNDIAIELQKRLEQGLASYELNVERDRNLKDKTVIGFFIYIEYFDKLIRKALAGQNPN